MPVRQNRLPGVKWNQYSSKSPQNRRGTPLRTEGNRDVPRRSYRPPNPNPGAREQPIGGPQQPFNIGGLGQPSGGEGPSSFYMPGGPGAGRSSGTGPSSHFVGGVRGPGAAGPSAVGDHFNIRGMGRYVNPKNSNGNQFNKPAIKARIEQAANAHTRAQYFRHAGLGAALRYTLGIPQVPSHLQDYINTRTHGRKQTGYRPGTLYSTYEGEA